MTNTNRKILIIDDDQDIWQAYNSILKYERVFPGNATRRIAALLDAEDQSKGGNDPAFSLSYASQGQEGYALIEQAVTTKDQFSVAFIDIRMPPGWDGMETAAKIRQIDPEIEIVIVTAYNDRSREEIVKAVGSPSKLLFLRKPFDPEELYQMALSLSEKWLLHRRESKAKIALSDSEAKYRALVETTPDFVWAMDTNGRYTYCSPVCNQIYKFSPEELLNQPFYRALMSGHDASFNQEFFERCVQEKIPFQNNERLCRQKDGTEVRIESSGQPVFDEHGSVIGFRGIDREVTERWELLRNKRLLEEQFQQAQKMEAIGALASGIAHDLNNVLTPIIGYAEICRHDSVPGSDLYRYQGIIKLSADKAADLIRQILSFSRKQPAKPVPCSLDHVIEKFVKILRRLIREDIALELKLADNRCSVKIDQSQMEQILINLVVNARDAISGTGQIVISTASRSIPAAQAEIDAMHQPFAGDYVLLSVSDNGQGMDPAITPKIFDPFFTTKEEGKGTGLGLATVFGVTRQYKGHIQLETQLGHGTTFKVYLPCSAESAREDEESAAEPSPPGGHETILVAEDDPIIRKLTVSLLENLGYTVLSAANGREAFKAFHDAEGRIDLLSTDVIMPDLGGIDLVKALRKEKESLPVIFISGYPQDFTPDGLLDTAHTEFIKKPFTANTLAEITRKLLDGSA